MSALFDNAKEFCVLYPHIVAKGVGAGFSEQFADVAIIQSINAIAKKTNAMRSWISIDYQDGVTSYPIAQEFDDRLMPHRLLNARYMGTPVDMGDGMDELDAVLDDDGTWVEICRLPCVQPKRPGLDKFMTHRPLDCDAYEEDPAMYQIDLELGLSSGPTMCEIPAAFFNRFWDEIALGASANMLEMARMPFTDQRLGALRRQEFMRALKRLRNDAVLDHTQRVREYDRRSWGMLKHRGQRGFA